MAVNVSFCDKINLVVVKGPQVAVVFARSGSKACKGLQGSGNTVVQLQMQYILDSSHIICYSSRRSGLVHATCPVVPKSTDKQVWNFHLKFHHVLHYLSRQCL
jgi:hypothetical protein